MNKIRIADFEFVIYDFLPPRLIDSFSLSYRDELAKINMGICVAETRIKND